jgi:SAM-dependent methyltransferase
MILLIPLIIFEGDQGDHQHTLGGMIILLRWMLYNTGEREQPRMSRIDRYADGQSISTRRRQKARILGQVIAELYPGRMELELVDFGCADGAIPVLLLNSPEGGAIRRITGITLLDYNDLPDKPAYAHPRFTRLVADLEGPLDGLTLPWGRCDVVTATAFLHYCADQAAPFRHAVRLLKPGGHLLASLPAPWVLRLRQVGVPMILPRNSHIRIIQSISAWRRLAEEQGFTELHCQAIQWLGIACTASVESWLADRRLPSWCGSNVLAIYRKMQPDHEENSSIDPIPER